MRQKIHKIPTFKAEKRESKKRKAFCGLTLKKPTSSIAAFLKTFWSFNNISCLLCNLFSSTVESAKSVKFGSSILQINHSLVLKTSVLFLTSVQEKKNGRGYSVVSKARQWSWQVRTEVAQGFFPSHFFFCWFLLNISVILRLQYWSFL